jgi:GDP-D-mannose 3',5'-epimerase
MKTALVLGGTGFIGTNLIKRLKKEGYWVRAVDIKHAEFGNEADELLLYDLRDARNVENVMRLDYINDIIMPFQYSTTAFTDQMPFDEVYAMACQMGGAGYIFTGENDSVIMHDSALINLHTANFAVKTGVKKLFYSSSACMYPQELQDDLVWIGGNKGWVDNTDPSLRESQAYPANPDSEYGWEKLFSERLYLAYQRNYNLNVRIARFHNIYGPLGTYKGGREKAPAAMCRKVIERDGDKIEVWGDGKQTRSFLYIDDCVDAIRLLMESDFKEPINIGSEEMVSIDELAKLVILESGKDIEIVHDLTKPQGVRGRNSNNDLIRKVLNWEPKYSLAEGIKKTYWWIQEQYNKTA